MFFVLLKCFYSSKTHSRVYATQQKRNTRADEIAQHKLIMMIGTVLWFKK